MNHCATGNAKALMDKSEIDMAVDDTLYVLKA
jgi:hypothetical protein